MFPLSEGVPAAVCGNLSVLEVKYLVAIDLASAADMFKFELDELDGLFWELFWILVDLLLVIFEVTFLAGRDMERYPIVPSKIITTATNPMMVLFFIVTPLKYGLPELCLIY